MIPSVSQVGRGVRRAVLLAWLIPCLLMMVVSLVLADDVDPFDPATPLDKAEQVYSDALKEQAAIKDVYDRQKMDPFLKALRDHLKDRGSKFDATGKLVSDGTASTPPGPATTKVQASAGQPADNGFRFGGLQFGGNLPKHVGSEPGGIGASWFIICVDIDVERDGANLKGSLRDLKLLAFSHSMADPKTVDGLSTAAHELAHVEQYKHAWERSHTQLRQRIALKGKDKDAIRNAAKAAVQEWFGPSFNPHFTGKGFSSGVKTKVRDVLKQDPDRMPPLEREPEIAEHEFKEDFKGKPKEARDEITKRSDGLKTSTAPPSNVTYTHLLPNGTRIKIRLFEDGKLIGLADPSSRLNPFETDPVKEEYALAFQVPERCVGTWHYFESGYSEPVTQISISYPEFAVPATPEEGTPQEPQIPVCTSPPPVTSMPPPVATPTPEMTPTPSSTPTDTPAPPPEDQTPPVTVTEVPQQPPEEPEPDLGLVKATEQVVELALSSAQTGEPVEGATVKLLAPAPELPNGAPSEAVLASTDNYQEDVPAADVDEAGTLQLSLGLSDDNGQPTQLALVEPELEPVENDTATDTATGEPPQGTTPVETRQIAIDTAPSQQMIVAGNRPMTSLPASLLPASSEICVNRGFRIGETPVFVLKVPEPEVTAFTELVSNSEAISFFEPDPCREKEVNDPHFTSKGLWGQDFDNQWAIKRVNIDENMLALKATEGARPVTVAVIDTGLDWYHPDLPTSKLWRNPGEVQGNGVDDDGNGYVDDIIGWNFVRPSRLPWDYDGHGTFVAGVIAAEQDNGIGIAGINPNARIMVLKALDAFGRGHASMVAEAIAYAADNGAQIINMSLGGRGLTSVERLAVEHARTKGAIVVVASGNDGKDVGGYSPAGLEGVITVSATDRRDRRAGFSNWGASVDIAAPGVDVLSLRARRTDLLSFIPGVKYRKGEGIVGDDRAYYRASGTSFATPIVAGTLSLLMSRRPELKGEQAVRMALQTARDIETPGVDNYTGYGLLDAEAALKADPAHFLESRIHAVKVVGGNAPALRVIASAEADQFDTAMLMLGQGDAPEKWLKSQQDVQHPGETGTAGGLAGQVLRRSENLDHPADCPAQEWH